ncbi:MAG TPA: aquaporin [Polyangia bacterium]|nr:aquaporin [Polyangia bacterium]
MTADARRIHWPEALMEALGLGLFMMSAGIFGTWLEYPGSPLHQAVPDPLARRALMGAAMGLTAIGLVYSPWGRRSGAHINPAFTLTFWRLGRVSSADAVAYVVAQFAGGLAGTSLVAALLGQPFLAPPVAAVATLPGPAGLAVAFGCEVAISFALVLLVLTLGQSPRWGRYTGLFVGATLFLYITFEAPLSGMSMNPARTLASAVPARTWQALWIYFAAPVAGMLLASEAHVRLARSRRAGCAKLAHSFPCIFCGSERR